MRLVRIGATAALLGCVFLISAVGGSYLTHSSPRALIDPATLYVARNYESATVRFRGRLSNLAQRALETAVSDTSVIVIVRATDIQKCEDFGRQIRELKRRVGWDRPIVFIGEASQPEVIREFLRIERIPDSRIISVAATQVLENNSDLPTPAVMIVTGRGDVVEGIAHPSRFPNGRFRSFAQEFVLLNRDSASSMRGSVFLP